MSDCLNELDFEPYQAQELGFSRTDEISRHLASCSGCRERHDAFSADQRMARLVREAVKEDCAAELPPFLIQIEGYDVVREIQRGGQGVVYEAIQLATKRKVALKVLLEGLFADARKRRRFEAEIELASTLQHPNIVSIHDSGLVEGHFFFAMEYVDGVRLDEYIQSKSLGAKEIVHLIAVVCEAVSYAHSRGVIHRDLKPSNIRVDDSGQPHLLDFGLAKRTEGDASSSQVAVTLTSEFVGTLAYAAPEQVLGQPSMVDTRSDVYALGVISYEMLTGQYPYPVIGQLAEVMKHITETDPKRPSTIQRRIDNELETIILKALSKSPEQRYQTAGHLHDDIERYLKGEPIEAKRASSFYVIRKLVTRHKLPFALISALFILLTGFAVIATVQAERTTREKENAYREKENAKQVSTFLQEMLAMADPANAKGPDVTVREMLDEFAGRVETVLSGQPEVQASLRDTIGATYSQLGLYDKAEPYLRSALAQRREIFGPEHPDVASSLANVGTLLLSTGQYTEAQALFRQALAIRHKLLGDEHEDTIWTLKELAESLRARGDYEAAEPLFREALASYRSLRGDEHLDVAATLHDLASLMHDKSDYGTAESLYTQALVMRRELLSNEHPDLAASLNDLGLLLQEKGNYTAAEPLLREALEIYSSLFDDEHPHVAASLNNLGLLLMDQGDYTAAEPIFRKALTIFRNLFGNEHTHVASCLSNLAYLLRMTGDYQAAEPLARETLAICRKLMGNEHLYVAFSLSNLAELLHDQGDNAAAEPLFREAVALFRKTFPEGHMVFGSSLTGLGDVLTDMNDVEQAAPLLREGLEMLRKTFPEGHWRIGVAQSVLGGCLTVSGHYDEAEPLLIEGYSILKEQKGEDYKYTLEALERIIELYDTWSKPEEAAEYRALLSAKASVSRVGWSLLAGT